MVIFAVLMTTLAYLQWVERKVIAHIQVRPGPYRVGPHGLLQPLADVIKLITKEDLVPPYVNKPLYLAAPFLAITMALLSISVIPFGPTIKVAGYQTMMQLTDLNIGVLFILAVSSMGVYGIALAGWSSNNKYALLGGLRSSAQMISYELPMSLAIAAPLLISNTLSLRELVERQVGGLWHWNLIHGGQIVSFVIFLIAAFAETNRVPFDLPEAENELVAGFHTEYSSMKFASFFMAEYANMITVSAMAVLLFLGGWDAPWPAQYGSSFVPVVIFALAGLVALYHGLHPARRRDRLTLPAFGDHLPDHRGALPAADCAELASAAVLVRGQGGLHSVRFHLGARHAAALPLRPTDALHLEGPFPGGRAEFAGDRLSGRLVFLTWTSYCF